jgi:hypothetical protein
VQKSGIWQATGGLSQEGSSFIRLDSKARLVLPLLLREGLGIAKGGPKDTVKIKVLSAADGKICLELAQPNETSIADALPFSKNGKEVKNEVKK